MFRFEGDATPIIFSLVVNVSQRNFVHGMTIKALAQIWKKLHKIDDDVIVVRKLAKKTVKRVYFKIATVSSSFIQSY